MPSNAIKINNGGKGLEFIIPDSKMDALLEYLNENGEECMSAVEYAKRDRG